MNNQQQLVRATGVLNVYVPTLGSRNQRRIDFIRDSIMQENNEDSDMAIPTTIPLHPVFTFTPQSYINWENFWKRVKIYPEQEVAYPDSSQHFSTRQRIRNFSRQRANAYVSDTESDSECELKCDTDDCKDNIVV